jgi:dephospho-CoA kinase
MLVYAPAATQLQRLRDRDGLDDTSAQRRLVAQLPIDDKRSRATWVIDNAGTRESTAAQVDTWWHQVVTQT